LGELGLNSNNQKTALHKKQVGAAFRKSGLHKKRVGMKCQNPMGYGKIFKLSFCLSELLRK
jgi:hypothetical protein